MHHIQENTYCLTVHVDFADTRRLFYQSIMDLFNLKLVTKENRLGLIERKSVSTTNIKMFLVLDPTLLKEEN